jgi:CDP-diacylglycerol--glycerol-3-phosphate 3-phosphatidyltransferase
MNNTNFKYLPTLLTFGRIGLIPIFVVAMYIPFKWGNEFAVLIFLVAAVTDWLDGFLARKLGLATAFGAFLDPVADKLMVAVALVIIVQHHPSMHMALAAAVIIGREITISALREWMAEMGKRVSVSYIGKFKTVLQMAALFFLIYEDPLWGIPIFELGQILLLAAVALTLWSMFLYLKLAWANLDSDMVEP